LHVKVLALVWPALPAAPLALPPFALPPFAAPPFAAPPFAAPPFAAPPFAAPPFAFALPLAFALPPFAAPPFAFALPLALPALSALPALLFGVPLLDVPAPPLVEPALLGMPDTPK
jgi:hypothetical protein